MRLPSCGSTVRQGTWHSAGRPRVTCSHSVPPTARRKTPPSVSGGASMLAPPGQRTAPAKTCPSAMAVPPPAGRWGEPRPRGRPAATGCGAGRLAAACAEADTAPGTGRRRPAMKLAYSPNSPYVRKVMACAIQRGIDGRIELWTVPTTDPSLAAVNPLSKVPTLTTDDGAVLYE